MQAPDGRGLTIADYVNEDSKRATVTVTGIINQVSDSRLFKQFTHVYVVFWAMHVLASSRVYHSGT